MRSNFLKMPTALAVFAFCFNAVWSQTVVTYPPRMYGDTLFAPFYHGVASGDPTPDAVFIWTRVSPPSPAPSEISVNWEFANDSSFTQIVASGVIQTDSTRDYTAMTDVKGLTANHYYYYRFTEPNGKKSQIGRTRTAVSGTVDSLKIGVASCSSIYSGYFNAYHHLGRRDDLNAFIHLGDYLYDFVDQDEVVRVPTPEPENPKGLDQWRERHKYYLLDPDLRLARQRHPWYVIWDNHDLDKSTPAGLAAAMQAFQEYVPTRLPDTTKPAYIFREFKLGNLVDLILLDTRTQRDAQTVADSVRRILSDEQHDWLIDQLETSAANWRLLGSEVMMNGWYSRGLPEGLAPDTVTFDKGSWDGFPAERKQVFDRLRAKQIDNVFVISGDAHVSVAADMNEDPQNPAKYNPRTGDGSVAVEFLPASITRGNMDEAAHSTTLGQGLADISKSVNPQHQYFDGTRHGYGLLTIRPDSIVADFIYFDKLKVAQTPNGGQTMTVLNGQNRWKRDTTLNARSANPTYSENVVRFWPNPAQTSISFRFTAERPQNLSVKLFQLADGKTVGEWTLPYQTAGQTQIFQLPIESLSAGIYGAHISGDGSSRFAKFVKQ